MWVVFTARTYRLLRIAAPGFMTDHREFAKETNDNETSHNEHQKWKWKWRNEMTRLHSRQEANGIPLIRTGTVWNRVTGNNHERSETRLTENCPVERGGACELAPPTRKVKSYTVYVPDEPQQLTSSRLMLKRDCECIRGYKALLFRECSTSPVSPWAWILEEMWPPRCTMGFNTREFSAFQGQDLDPREWPIKQKRFKIRRSHWECLDRDVWLCALNAWLSRLAQNGAHELIRPSGSENLSCRKWHCLKIQGIFTPSKNSIHKFLHCQILHLF